MGIASINLHEPDPEVIELLESILERAKMGDINGFILVADVQGGSSTLYSEGEYSRPTMVGQLELLKLRLLTTWMNDGKPRDEPEPEDHEPEETKDD